jgi:hypothetical protein
MAEIDVMLTNDAEKPCCSKVAACRRGKKVVDMKYAPMTMVPQWSKQ